jgi:Tfp pilus assembly protein FimT
LIGNMNHRSQTSTGLSMLEVVLAITLAGILLAVVIVRLDINRREVDGTVQRLSSVMLTAQREAKARQHDMILTIDQLNRRVRVIWDGNGSGRVDPGEGIQVVNLSSRVTFGLGGAPARAFGPEPVTFNETVGGLPALTFHPNGRASGVDGFYLTTTRAIAAAANGSLEYAEDTRAVEISPATGQSQWFRYSSSSWIRRRS